MQQNILPVHVEFGEIETVTCVRRLTERELWQRNESSLIAVAGPVGERLSHQVGVVETLALERFLHQFERLQRRVGVEVTVGADDLSTLHDTEMVRM